MPKQGSSVKRKGSTSDEDHKNKKVKLNAEEVSMLNGIKALGIKADVILGNAVVTKEGDIKVSEKEMKKLNKGMLDVISNILTYIKKKAFEFVSDNRWLLLIAGFIGVGLACTFLAPAVVAAEFLGMVGVSSPAAAVVGGAILAGATTLVAFKLAMKLYESFANYLMEKKLDVPKDHPAINSDTRSYAKTFIERSSKPVNSVRM